MPNAINQYPKCLAFIKLFYPALYEELCSRSDKADIVEANLIYRNSFDTYTAIVYSEGAMQDGELLNIHTGKSSVLINSWDWRWVFAATILYNEKIVLPLSFKQKVIALPTGKHPLTSVFFDNIQKEFTHALQKISNIAVNENLSMRASYARYCDKQ